MNNNHSLQSILTELTVKVKDLYGSNLERAILYGSCARQDNTDESDIDVMIIVSCNEDDLTKLDAKLNLIESRMSLTHDVMLSIFVRTSEHYNRWKDSMPFYCNIEREGVEIIAS